MSPKVEFWGTACASLRRATGNNNEKRTQPQLLALPLFLFCSTMGCFDKTAPVSPALAGFDEREKAWVCHLSAGYMGLFVEIRTGVPPPHGVLGHWSVLP